MTAWIEMKDDPDAIKCLDHGFVRLDGSFGDDQTIVRSARVSYGQNNANRMPEQDRHLIRYMLRHNHTSPFEQVEFRFHMKLPIFVARQLIRHRTASVNEYSGRYSEMPNEFYIPSPDVLAPQSKSNHQGRSGEMDKKNKESAEWFINAASETNYDIYQTLLGNNRENPDASYGPFDGDMFDDDFDGIAKELARMVLPLNNYTEWYWKCDLKNLLHFLKLREDSHAQWEIQVFANAMHELIKNSCPIALEAYEDYISESISLSRMEGDLVKFLAKKALVDVSLVEKEEWFEKAGLTGRELIEFKEKLDL